MAGGSDRGVDSELGLLPFGLVLVSAFSRIPFCVSMA